MNSFPTSMNPSAAAAHKEEREAACADTRCGSSSSCGSSPRPAPRASLNLSFSVGGMTCAACAQRLTAALQLVSGVVSARVSFLSRQADVVVCASENASVAAAVMDCVARLGFFILDGEETSSHVSLLAQQGSVGAQGGAATSLLSARASMSVEAQRLADAFSSSDPLPNSGNVSSSEGDEEDSEDAEDAGYAAEGKRTNERCTAMTKAPSLTRTTLLIEGMSCGSCAARIERDVARMPGVSAVSVSATMMSGQVKHDARAVPVAELLNVIASLGYTPTLRSSVVIAGGNRSGAAPRAAEADTAGATAASLFSHRFLVEGMSCASCAARVERAVMALPYVVGCTVSVTTGTAAVTTNRGAREDRAEVERSIRALGYAATVLGGPPSAAAARQRPLGYNTLASADETVDIVFADNEAGDVDGTSDTARTRSVLERRQEIEKQRSNFLHSAVLCVPLVIAMLIMAFTDVMETSSTMSLVVDAVQLLCATPIVFATGKQFFIGAWRSFQHGAYTMDTLVAIGTGCSYAYSLVAFVASATTGVHLMTYFDTAGMLTTFMLLGRYLEARAKRTTSGALIELMSLVPPMATVVTADGDIRVASSRLKVGDHVRVLAGDRIPVDGTIVDGQSDVDEQLVTGESVPKSCGPRDGVVGGTLNVTATLLIVVDKVGEDTLLSQILKIVQEAQNTKPAVQRVADRMAMYFVPFVVLSSLLTLAVWLILGVMDAYPASWRPHGVPAEAFAFNFFIATVVAACPCALGLATPTAIMVGTGVGAQSGVLVKSGVTLETVRRATCVVFDKTGTVTNGQLKVCSAQSFGGVAPGAPLTLVKQLVAAVEDQSTHPIAKAVARDLLGGGGDANASQTEVLTAVTHVGRGVAATVAVTETHHRTWGTPAPPSSSPSPSLAVVEAGGGGGAGQYVQQYNVLIGNVPFMTEQQVPVGRDVTDAVQQCHSQGQTTVVCAVDGRIVLVVALADEAKAEAYGVIAYLHKHNIRTLMVTGDNRLVAASVARAVGISFDNVRAEALPATKAKIVKELQAEGLCVMFVGDGLNDSGALAQADVGVALGAGTEVAIEAADAVLVRNSLVDLLSLRRLSQVTVRRIYGNFVWAFGYNLLMLPLASGLLYPLLRFQLPPVVAGAAMVFSSLSVLTSSLTIRCFRPYKQEEFVGSRWP